MKTLFPIVLSILSLTAAAEVSVVYEGVLRKGDGAPLAAGLCPASVSLYETPESSQCLWTRQYDLYLDTNGLFRIELRDSAKPVSGADVPTDTLASVLRRQSAGSIYVGVRPNKDKDTVEVKPRQRLLDVPYALVATDAIGSRSAFTANEVVTNGGFVTRQSASEVDLGSQLTIGKALTFTSGANVPSTKLTAKGMVSVVRDAKFNNPVTVANAIRLEKGEFIVNGDLTTGRQTTAGKKDTDVRSATVGDLKVKRREKSYEEPAVIVNKVNGSIPVGTVIMWYGLDGAKLPEDWVICDGRPYEALDGTVKNAPNLVDRFPVGAGKSFGKNTASDGGQEYALGSTGGATNHVLTLKETPEHTHTYEFLMHGAAVSVAYAKKKAYLSLEKDGRPKADFDGVVDYWKLGVAGEGKGHENMPLHKRIHYVMKIR